MLGDNTGVYAYGIGTVCLNPHVFLERVLFIPDLGTRLLSVSAVTRLGCQIIFDCSGCKIWKDNVNILSASPSGNLLEVDLVYHANISKATPIESPTHCKTTENRQSNNVISTIAINKHRGHNLQLGHQRLGHLNVADVQQLAKLATGLSINQA